MVKETEAQNGFITFPRAHGWRLLYLALNSNLGVKTDFAFLFILVRSSYVKSS